MKDIPLPLDEDMETLHTIAIDVTDLDTMQHRAIEHRPRGRQRRGSITVRVELLSVGLLLLVAFLARWYAALHTGLEVDEPIYHDAAQGLLQYGFPTIRPAYNHPITPFLYHPPFFFFLLAGWFRLWGSTSYFTGRMLSVVISCVMLLEIYLMLRQMAGRVVALLALTFLASDLWIIFTNQAIYLENSQMILVVSAIWVYWRATHVAFTSRWRQSGWFALAGVLIGCVIIYKQIGGFIALAVLLNFILQRKYWWQHLLLIFCALFVVGGYVLSMHQIFGHLYDAATLDQISRTFGKKGAPGLNDGPLTAVEAFLSRYWMFFITFITLVCGFLVIVVRYFQALFLRKKIAHPLLVSWALSGMLFAAGISLKSPHYLILWIIPLYTVLASELGGFILNWKWRLVLPGARPRQAWALNFLILFCLLFSVGDAFGFQARFVYVAPDALEQAELYANTMLPHTALIVTENYIGVDLSPAFLDIALVNTPRLLADNQVSYLMLYWTQTQPVPASLGPVNSYCVPRRTFTGFKDTIEICQINPTALRALLT